MILTVTLNPALDVTYTVDSVVAGATHRVLDTAVSPGGKGLNVARVLRILGVGVCATGLLGGLDGARIAELLMAEGVTIGFAPIAGESRRTVVATDGVEATGFWEPGPSVTAEEWAEFVELFRARVSRAGVVVLAGSLPRGVPGDAYGHLVGIARSAGVPTVLDADGAALRAGLDAQPAVVKPNAAELAEATGHAVDTVSQARTAARVLRDGRATAVIASLGESGLVMSTADGDWHARLAQPLAGNATGAGDACVAALAAGLHAGHGWRDLLVDAVACSAAAVAEPVAGRVAPDRIRRLRETVQVEEI